MDNRNLTGQKTGPSSANAHRPAGFKKSAPSQPAERSPAASVEKPVKKKKPAFKAASPRRTANRTQPKDRKRNSGKHGLSSIFVIAALVAVIGAIVLIVILTGSRTVHQMPVILRITEEPTAPPEETAMLLTKPHPELPKQVLSLPGRETPVFSYQTLPDTIEVTL